LAQPESLHTALDILRRRAELVTPSGSALHATTRVGAVDGLSTVELEITDGGPTLPASRLGTLFDPYPDPHAPHATQWLELAAAAGIVRSHGGFVVAESAGGTGTLVRVTLPLHNGDGLRPSLGGGW
jgi:K+-sensing histidine kinase KdpD